MKNGYKKDYGLEKKFFRHRDLREMLRYCAEEYGDKTAFITKIKIKDQEPIYVNTSYAGMFHQMGELGTALIERGFKDARVAVIGENSYKWVLAYLTAACGVGVTVPLDKGLQKEELISCINRASCRVIFYDEKHREMIEDIVSEGSTGIELAVDMDRAGDRYLPMEVLMEEGKELLEKGDRRYLDADIDADALSFLLFTSGTTEQSKAVMLSHNNLMASNYSMNLEELFFPDDVTLLILPLHHIYGFSGLVVFMSQGLTNTFCDGVRYIASNMKEYRVSVFSSVPLLLENMYKKMITAIEKKGQTKTIQRALAVCDASDKLGINLRKKLFKPIIDQLGGRLRFITNGAAALDPVVQKGLNDFGILTVQGYGLTECSPTIASETYRYLKPGSCGKMMPFVEPRIIDKDEDGIGELVVRGDNVMLGYYDNPQATEEVMKDGWFHTGDLAYFDEDGYLFITGRKKNVIVMKNGKNVFPEEIENLINMLPYVEESIVFTQNKMNDYVLWAKVVYDKEYLKEKGITKEDLALQLEEDMDKINEGMPSYKMVKHSFLSDRPTIKTTTAKTKRKDEMKQIEEELLELGLKN